MADKACHEITSAPHADGQQFMSHRNSVYLYTHSILASVSFWPLLIIDSVCPSTCFSRTNCSLSRYNAKGKLDCFNCKTGVFLRLFILMKAITIHVVCFFFCFVFFFGGGGNQLLYMEYLTTIKKIKRSQSTDRCID